MPEISTSIQLTGKPSQIREKFFEFEKFPTFTKALSISKFDSDEPIRNVKVGDHLSIGVNSKFDEPNSVPMIFTPFVTTVSATRFSWLGVLFSKYIFRGEHIFEFQSLDDGNNTLLLHKEEFGGLIAHILLFFIRKDTTRAFNKFNQDFKIYVESH